MGKGIKFVKKLASELGESVEEAERRVRAHTAATGNEALTFGHFGAAPDDIRELIKGTRTGAKMPDELNRFVDLHPGKPWYSIHTHPEGFSTAPSTGDLNVWAKPLSYAGFSPATRHPFQNMLIASGPDEGLLRLGAANTSDLPTGVTISEMLMRNANMGHGAPEWEKYRDLFKAHGISPTTQNFYDLDAGRLLNKMASYGLPVQVDDATKMAGQHVNLSDIWPEVNKMLEGKAEGGPVDDSVPKLSELGSVMRAIKASAKGALSSPSLQSSTSQSLAADLRGIAERKGDEQVERLIKAQDLGVNLTPFTQRALEKALGTSSRDMLSVIDPADFQKFAARVPFDALINPDYDTAGEFLMSGRRGELSDVLRNYANAAGQGLWRDVPELHFGSPTSTSLGLGQLPTTGHYPVVTAHEGRHRNMALQFMDEPKSLVRIRPSYSQNERLNYLQPDDAAAMFRKGFDVSKGKVIPETEWYDPLASRGLTEATLPSFGERFADGGPVKMAGGTDKVVRGVLRSLSGARRDAAAEALARTVPEGNFLPPEPRLQSPLITDPNKLAYPGVYKRPSTIAQEASDLIEAKAPDLGRESNLFKVFGIHRDDLPDIVKDRWDYPLSDVAPKTAPPRARGSAVTESVFTPANIQHQLDVVSEALNHSNLYNPGRYWYAMDPAWDAARKAGASDDFLRRLNTNMGFFSMQASPVDEIARGIPANFFANQGRARDFARHVDVPSFLRTDEFPAEMTGIPGHARHKSQTLPYIKFAETGDPGFAKDTVKVPHYIAATDPVSPFWGNFVADSHNARGLKYPDVRVMNTPGDVTANMSGSEFWDALPHYQKMARQAGMTPTELQALTWNAFGPQTGVDVIGKPKIELLADHIANRANILGLPLDVMRDEMLTGKRFEEGGPVGHLSGGKVRAAAGGKRGVLTTLEKLAKGKPETVKLPGHGEVPTYPIKEIEDEAAKFAAKQGNQYPVESFPEFDAARAKKIAEAYENMQHNPFDPATKRAYEALIDETMDQYKALSGMGINFEFMKPGEGNPYKTNPALGYADLLQNNRMKVYPTLQPGAFGTLSEIENNPLLRNVGKVGDLENATANDAFRVVHDVYGHYGPGNPFFRSKGEDRAWLMHGQLYSPDALPAATSELRGQNSWVNYGPHAEANRFANQDKTIYADQKVGLLPPWVWSDIKDVNKKAEGGMAQHFDEGGGPKGVLSRMADNAASWRTRPFDEYIDLLPAAAKALAKHEGERFADNAKYNPALYGADLAGRLGNVIDKGASNLWDLTKQRYHEAGHPAIFAANTAYRAARPIVEGMIPSWDFSRQYGPSGIPADLGLMIANMPRKMAGSIGESLLGATGFAGGGGVLDGFAPDLSKEGEFGLANARKLVPGATDMFGDMPDVARATPRLLDTPRMSAPSGGGGGGGDGGAGQMMQMASMAMKFLPLLMAAKGGRASSLRPDQGSEIPSDWILKRTEDPEGGGELDSLYDMVDRLPVGNNRMSPIEENLFRNRIGLPEVQPQGYADGGRRMQPQMVPGFVDFPLGEGNASLGIGYDPADQGLSLEGGYEHPVGRGMLGAQGHFRKNIGPPMEGQRDEYGGRLQYRLPFAEGGSVDDDMLAYHTMFYGDGGQVQHFDDGGQAMTQESPDSGVAGNILGMVGGMLGNLIPIPILGPMIGKFAGHALGSLFEGKTGEIGDMAARDFTMGVADPDRIDQSGGDWFGSMMKGIPGLGGLGGMFGGSGGGGGIGGGGGFMPTDLGSFGGGESGMTFAEGGQVGPMSGSPLDFMRTLWGQGQQNTQGGSGGYDPSRDMFGDGYGQGFNPDGTPRRSPPPTNPLSSSDFNYDPALGLQLNNPALGTPQSAPQGMPGGATTPPSGMPPQNVLMDMVNAGRTASGQGPGGQGPAALASPMGSGALSGGMGGGSPQDQPVRGTLSIQGAF